MYSSEGKRSLDPEAVPLLSSSVLALWFPGEGQWERESERTPLLGRRAGSRGQGSGVRAGLSDGCHKPMQPGLPWRLSGEKLPFKQRQMWVQSLGWEDPLEKEVASCPSILAWRIPLDRGALRATVRGVAEVDTAGWLNNKRAPVPSAALSLAFPSSAPHK